MQRYEHKGAQPFDDHLNAHTQYFLSQRNVEVNKLCKKGTFCLGQSGTSLN
jgi:hypothetical protein